MRYFIFSDVHGCYYDLINALNNAGYDENNKDHFLVFLGDAFDHNKTGHYLIYKFFKKQIENNKMKWILGNHEIYLLNALKSKKPSKFTHETVRDIANGLVGDTTKLSDEECINVLNNNGVYDFIKNNCIDYFEIGNYICTHGIIPYKEKTNEYDPLWRINVSYNWNHFRCMNGQKIVLNGFSIPNKTLVCGHVGAYFGNLNKKYPNIDINSKEFEKLAKQAMKNAKTEASLFNIYYGDGIIGLDSRAYDTHNVNVLIIEEE